MDNSMEMRRAREDHIVSLREKICYGLGDSACNVVYGLCSTLLTFFYTDYVGISAAVVGIIFLITRVFDGVSDIIMGFITDRTKSKYGKARPWILWMAVPYAVTFVALFFVPANASVMVQAIYIFVTYNLVNTVVYTALNLPYSTMASLITRDQKSRTSTQAIRIFCGPMGKMVVTVSTLPLVKALGNTQKSWIIVSVIFAVIALVLLLVCFFNIEERVVIEAAQNKKVSVGENLKALFSNQYWAICLGLWGVMVMMSTVSGTITTYYCKYMLGNEALYSPIYAAELIAQSIVVLIVPHFVTRFGKRNLTLAGIVLVIVAQFVWITNPLSVTVAMTSAVLRGIGVAPPVGMCIPHDCRFRGIWPVEDSRSSRRHDFQCGFGWLQAGRRLGIGGNRSVNEFCRLQRSCSDSDSGSYVDDPFDLHVCADRFLGYHRGALPAV